MSSTILAEPISNGHSSDGHGANRHAVNGHGVAAHGINGHGTNGQEKTGHDEKQLYPVTDNWFYPPDIANDLKNVALPEATKREIFATAFEYARCVIPAYTNWNRYIAFMRIFIMGIIAEFKGEMVDVAAGDEILGYNLSSVLQTLFDGTPHPELMAREFRTFLLITAHKTNPEWRKGELFRRYVNALAKRPQQWFRIRDTDALCRFTIAAALACNDQDHVWFTDQQFEILTEIGDMMYDAVSFYKHRAEGETNSTFAYYPEDLREQSFRIGREILWALDAAWARRPELAHVLNFLRQFGGVIHMEMRRYRFVEENLSIGRPETVKVVEQTRRNFKLWNRMDGGESQVSPSVEDHRRYLYAIDHSSTLMFDGLAEYLKHADEHECPDCRFYHSYGANESHEFGGAEVCQSCKENLWRPYFTALRQRAVSAFPELAPILVSI